MRKCLKQGKECKLKDLSIEKIRIKFSEQLTFVLHVALFNVYNQLLKFHFIMIENGRNKNSNFLANYVYKLLFHILELDSPNTARK